MIVCLMPERTPTDSPTAAGGDGWYACLSAAAMQQPNTLVVREKRLILLHSPGGLFLFHPLMSNSLRGAERLWCRQPWLVERSAAQLMDGWMLIDDPEGRAGHLTAGRTPPFPQPSSARCSRWTVEAGQV